MSDTKKTCSRCQEEKPLNAFHAQHYYCKECHNLSRRKPTGPYKLSEEKQIQLATDLLNDIKLSVAGMNVGVHPATIALWKRKGVLNEFLSEYTLEDNEPSDTENDEIPDL